ncbi:RNase A-like domain-containing protein [Vibrio neptunius]|uniref:Bacterial CdiA-CT RNAse A domain-containing protein n=1 Tax=Vibrio neptunius TaxID=170651 RepID=A0ABS3A2F2_9VIBR|nr:RNase A-like domain-containing protein [Vibrio neptunius]MBN3492716.1 hypothetical protein [Vibrio neptunius]MBN3515213.1 hypothetical protein [Vibrio neptunius]MBN3548911.1 hypothetical protein [Vibrio neptunius]MBN3577373.1 hypothetical protein [Vibrio neptunius]MCH9871037.1 hypothetical protein [Vibrio neptunius]
MYAQVEKTKENNCRAVAKLSTLGRSMNQRTNSKNPRFKVFQRFSMNGIVPESNNGGPVPFNLQDEENAHGHTLERHVNLTPEDAAARAWAKNGNVGRFSNLASATSTVRNILTAHHNDITNLNVNQRGVYDGLIAHHGNATVYEPDGDTHMTNTARVVVQCIAPNTYNLITAFPIN